MFRWKCAVVKHSARLFLHLFANVRVPSGSRAVQPISHFTHSWVRVLPSCVQRNIPFLFTKDSKKSTVIETCQSHRTELLFSDWHTKNSGLPKTAEASFQCHGVENLNENLPIVVCSKQSWGHISRKTKQEDRPGEPDTVTTLKAQRVHFRPGFPPQRVKPQPHISVTADFWATVMEGDKRCLFCVKTGNRDNHALAGFMTIVRDNSHETWSDSERCVRGATLPKFECDRRCTCCIMRKTNNAQTCDKVNKDITARLDTHTHTHTHTHKHISCKSWCLLPSPFLPSLAVCVTLILLN